MKQQPGRDLQIHGSARLGQSLLAAGLIDELRLVIAPVVVGNGRRLFPDGGAPAGLRLVSNDKHTRWAGDPGLRMGRTSPIHATYSGASAIVSPDRRGRGS